MTSEVTKNEIVTYVSKYGREWVHDVNNSVFVVKGFLEEIQEDLKSEAYLKEEYNKDNLIDMITRVTKNIAKLETNVQTLRTFVKEDIFKKFDVPKPLS